MNNFPQTIRSLRRSHGMTQKDLGNALGVTFQAVSRWERGQSFPDIALIPKIAAVFSVTIDSLFDFESTKRRFCPPFCNHRLILPILSRSCFFPRCVV